MCHFFLFFVEISLKLGEKRKKKSKQQFATELKMTKSDSNRMFLCENHEWIAAGLCPAIYNDFLSWLKWKIACHLMPNASERNKSIRPYRICPDCENTDTQKIHTEARSRIIGAKEITICFIANMNNVKLKYFMLRIDLQPSKRRRRSSIVISFCGCFFCVCNTVFEIN